MTIAFMAAAMKALVVLSVLILIIGLIKPKWVLFWLDQPNRVLASGIALLLFMVSMTAYTQLTVQPKKLSERERTNQEMKKLNKESGKEEMNSLDLGH